MSIGVSENLLVIPAFDREGGGKIAVAGKAFASSLMRSLFGGRIVVIHDSGIPWFKVERKQLDEIHIPARSLKSPMESWPHLVGELGPQPRQWVIVAHPASMTLRNIDHLIRPDSTGSYPEQEVDFYWTPTCVGEAKGNDEILASPGFWAVRAEYIPLVLEHWTELRKIIPRGFPEAAMWTRLVHGLPLRKKRFEKGEVIAPGIGAVDWEAVSNAAVVTVPDWPVAEQRKFLQALYFGTYLGDDTGMMLHVLES